MSVTREDLREFQRFADERLSCGEVASLTELAGQWESKREEMEQTVGDIRESHADIEAGRVHSVTDSFAEARRQLEKSR